MSSIYTLSTADLTEQTMSLFGDFRLFDRPKTK
jgi:hypothetical protein